jgi:dTDP-4-dehydrorhamnose 3,5-epimerase
MNFIKKNIENLYEIKNKSFVDNRGEFIKVYNNEFFNKENISFNIEEIYFSKSYKNVIRGMHFQIPPYDHDKLVYVTEGVILDVILDLRYNSKTFKDFEIIEISQNQNAVLIPKGCAHGFLTLSNSATVIYNVSSVYNQQFDSGILWNSFGFDWPVENPILSNRDQSFKELVDFKTPFF